MKRFNFSKMMHVDGRIYPSSERPLTLHAVFKDGSVAVENQNCTGSQDD